MFVGSLNYEGRQQKLKWIDINKNIKEFNQFQIIKGKGRFYLNQNGERKGAGSLNKMIALAETLDKEVKCEICGRIPENLSKKDLLSSGWINFGIKIGILCSNCLE